MLLFPRTVAGTDCNTADDGNAGCGVKADAANNYGPAFNAAGGGIYAMERTDTFIRVFFWDRGDASTPADVSSGAASIDTDNWVCISSSDEIYAIVTDSGSADRRASRMRCSRTRTATWTHTSARIILLSTLLSVRYIAIYVRDDH